MKRYSYSFASILGSDPTLMEDDSRLLKTLRNLNVPYWYAAVEFKKSEVFHRIFGIDVLSDEALTELLSDFCSSSFLDPSYALPAILSWAEYYKIPIWLSRQKDPYFYIDEQTISNSFWYKIGPTGETILSKYCGPSSKMVLIPRTIHGRRVHLVGKRLFSLRADVENIVLSPGITALEETAFIGLLHLKRIYFPNSLKWIPSRACAQCISLETVHLPAFLQRIGSLAFAGCEELKNISFPRTLKVMHVDSFDMKNPALFQDAGLIYQTIEAMLRAKGLAIFPVGDDAA